MNNHNCWMQCHYSPAINDNDFSPNLPLITRYGNEDFQQLLLTFACSICNLEVKYHVKFEIISLSLFWNKDILIYVEQCVSYLKNSYGVGASYICCFPLLLSIKGCIYALVIILIYRIIQI